MTSYIPQLKMLKYKRLSQMLNILNELLLTKCDTSAEGRDVWTFQYRDSPWREDPRWI